MRNIQIKKVSYTDKALLKKFMLFAWDVNQNDPSWVAPLLDSYKKVFDPKVNPFFLHGEMELFVAEENGKIVGRIAAIINHLHNKTWNDKVGFFGFYESFDDQEVANHLLSTVQNWLRQRGYTHMRGPASPTSNEDYGVLVDGFQHRQVILSTHNAPYYFKLYNTYGLQPIKDLYAFRFDGKKIYELNHERIDRMQDSIMKRYNLTLENINMKKFAEGVKTFKGLFNKAWTTQMNHGWVPLTDEEFDFITGDLKSITDPNLVMFAKINGEVVGGCICLPDYNEIFKKWNGRIFPFNWIDMFTKAKKLQAVRIIILGVVPEHQKKGIDAIMYMEIVKRGLARGATWAEASYIVEDNEPMKRPLLNIGGEIYKTYKVMEMPV